MMGGMESVRWRMKERRTRARGPRGRPSQAVDGSSASLARCGGGTDLDPSPSRFADCRGDAVHLSFTYLGPRPAARLHRFIGPPSYLATSNAVVWETLEAPSRNFWKR